MTSPSIEMARRPSVRSVSSVSSELSEDSDSEEGAPLPLDDEDARKPSDQPFSFAMARWPVRTLRIPIPSIGSSETGSEPCRRPTSSPQLVQPVRAPPRLKERRFLRTVATEAGSSRIPQPEAGPSTTSQPEAPRTPQPRSPAYSGCIPPCILPPPALEASLPSPKPMQRAQPLSQAKHSPYPRPMHRAPTPPQARGRETGVETGISRRAKTNRKPDKPSFKMFSLGQDSKLLGAGHVVLNVLRAFNLIGLAAAMMASMAMPILSGIKGHFFFFDMITHVFVFLIGTFLFVSELPVPWKRLKGYFERNWPVLGPDHSLAWLGWGMVFIGFQILGDLWKPGYAVETIGQDWWRAILAAAILSATFGFANITASVIFRLSRNATADNVKVTSRQIRTHGNLALQNASNKTIDIDTSFVSTYSPPHRDNFSARSWTKERAQEDTEVEPSSAVRRITRVFNPRNYNFRKSRIQISKPIPQQHDMPMPVSMPVGPVPVDDAVDLERGYTSHSHGTHGSHGRHDHDDDRASPIIPTLQRPPTALHPAFTGGSRYSEAHMDRF